jgi:protocatechuate 3,4-dioxygenase beta subunit
MQELDQYSITDAVVEQMSTTTDPRLKEVMEIVIRHVHEILREADITPAELFTGIQFLTDVGQKCTPTRQEFMILSAVLGVESVVNVLNDVRTGERGTRTSIFGPFYLDESPLLKNGDSLLSSDHDNIRQIALYGTVTDSAGTPIENASIEIWQTDETGLYDVQHKEERDVRGRVLTDAQGRYYLRTVPPLGYSIPMDGPTGALVRAQHRHGMRPAHVHFRITAPGYRDLITALYLRSDQYVASDTAFGVTGSLVRDIVDDDPNSPFPGLPGLNFDVMMQSALVRVAAAV